MSNKGQKPHDLVLFHSDLNLANEIVDRLTNIVIVLIENNYHHISVIFGYCGSKCNMGEKKTLPKYKYIIV